VFLLYEKLQGILLYSCNNSNNMSYFAHITNGKVDNIIVIDQEMIDTGAWGDPSEWVECKKKGYVKGEGKQARIGDTHDTVKNKFICRKPFDSWVLNADDEWEAPVKKKKGEEPYEWIEEKTRWEPIDKSKIK